MFLRKGQTPYMHAKAYLRGFMCLMVLVPVFFGVPGGGGGGGGGWGGVLLGIFGGGVPPASPNADPISDQKMPFSTPVFRPDLA